MVERHLHTAPSACLRCAAAGPTCCTVAAGNEECRFPISDMEQERIRHHLDARGPEPITGEQGPFATAPNSHAFIAGMKILFPGEQQRIKELFPENGTHHSLAVTPSGDCALLSDSGCTLPRGIRPLYCLLFPFWIRKERLALFTPPTCIVVCETRTVHRCMESMHMTEQDIRALYSQLRHAWGLSPLDVDAETL